MVGDVFFLIMKYNVCVRKRKRGIISCWIVSSLEVILRKLEKKIRKKERKLLTFLLKGGILKYRKKQVVRTSKTYKDIKEKKDKKKEIKD